MLVDIHTHIDNQSVIKIIDNNSEERILRTEGIHPWEAERNYKCSEAEPGNPFSTETSCNEGFLHCPALRFAPFEITEVFAIGEVGLDRIHKETFGKQIEIFEEMIRLSESYHKPMIIHCVRAYSEIIGMRKKTKAIMPWVVHGFNSSVETMQQLLRHDMYISLGEILYRNENQAVEILNNIPSDKLFLETDVSGRDIRDVYFKAAKLLNCDIKVLCRQIFENYGRLETTYRYINR